MKTSPQILLSALLLTGCCLFRNSASNVVFSSPEERAGRGLGPDVFDSSEMYWGIYGVVLTNLHVAGNVDAVLKSFHDAWQRAAPSVKVPDLMLLTNADGAPSLSL